MRTYSLPRVGTVFCAEQGVCVPRIRRFLHEGGGSCLKVQITVQLSVPAVVSHSVIMNNGINRRMGFLCLFLCRQASSHVIVAYIYYSTSLYSVHILSALFIRLPTSPCSVSNSTRIVRLLTTSAQEYDQSNAHVPFFHYPR